MRMNERERFVNALLFKTVDKVPFFPGNPRESTLKRWHEEGLPESQHWLEYIERHLGISLKSPSDSVSLALSFSLIPEFEEKILERKEGHLIVQMHTGEVVEISDDFDFSYLRKARDFVTRKWYKFPVENEHDWEEMKKRYNPSSVERYPADIKEIQQKLLRRDYPSGITIPGPFWQLRDWCGFENLCMLMVEKPGFVLKMADFWKGFVLEVLKRGVSKGSLDYVIINEDMAYKEKSMISPGMARKFLFPAWVEWVEFLKSMDCPLVVLDSDGYIGELIPLWIEAGINVTIPLERAAGNDIVEFRREFGKKIAFWGGVDKRNIAKGGRYIEEEIEHILPVIKEGGYIPSCDHGVPPDISLANFLYYCELLGRATGWL